jgi:hypothetical protein
MRAQVSTFLTIESRAARGFSIAIHFSIPFGRIGQNAMEGDEISAE